MLGKRSRPLTREEIERAFVRAGWKIAESSPHLVAGNADNLSILAYGSMTKIDEPFFELVDRKRVRTYWVRVVPPPRVAAVLIDKHGGAPEAEQGLPRER